MSVRGFDEHQMSFLHLDQLPQALRSTAPGVCDARQFHGSGEYLRFIGSQRRMHSEPSSRCSSRLVVDMHAFIRNTTTTTLTMCVNLWRIHCADQLHSSHTIQILTASVAGTGRPSAPPLDRVVTLVKVMVSRPPGR